MSKRSLCRLASVATITGFCSALLNCIPAVQAESSASAQMAIQAVCNRTTISYERGDLLNFMAMYSPTFVVQSVSGRKINFLEGQAAIANIFAKKDLSATVLCTVSQITHQGNQVHAILHWHYQTYHLRSASARAYVVVRDYEEQSIWKESFHGWQETSTDIMYDVEAFRR